MCFSGFFYSIITKLFTSDLSYDQVFANFPSK